MTEPDPPPDSASSPDKPSDKPAGKGDTIALGIGCAVFVIMFIAIVLVGMGQR